MDALQGFDTLHNAFADVCPALSQSLNRGAELRAAVRNINAKTALNVRFANLHAAYIGALADREYLHNLVLETSRIADQRSIEIIRLNEKIKQLEGEKK